MKKTLNTLIVMLLMFTAVLNFTACKKDDKNNPDINPGTAQNLIILIGDGMGLNHIHNTKTYFGLNNQGFENNYVANINTNSLTDGEPTDSSAAATALATGTSVYNGEVGYTSGQNLKNIMEYASDKNMLTGIITNDNLYGATPAGFSTHAKNRGDTTDIILGQSVSPIDLMIGKYDEAYYANQTAFTSNGFVMCNNKEDLYNTPSSQKVVANLNNIYSIYNPNKTNQTNMVDLVRYAVNYLDNENGFVLMIECGYIDKFSHSNDIVSALAEVRTLFDIANYVCEYIDNNNDTALIVTADHETGGLQKANNKNQINNNLFTTGAHTNSKVGLFVRGMDVRVTNEPKNTFVYEICYKVVEN